jgi:hypothetical protein
MEEGRESDPSTRKCRDLTAFNFNTELSKIRINDQDQDLTREPAGLGNG